MRHGGEDTAIRCAGFLPRYFFPSNIFLAVQGDFNRAAMKAQIEKLFADWTAKQRRFRHFRRSGSLISPELYLAVKPEATQTNISIGQPGGELKDPDFPALEVMAIFLARLQQPLIPAHSHTTGPGYEWGRVGARTTTIGPVLDQRQHAIRIRTRSFKLPARKWNEWE